MATIRFVTLLRRYTTGCRAGTLQALCRPMQALYRMPRPSPQQIEQSKLPTYFHTQKKPCIGNFIIAY